MSDAQMAMHGGSAAVSPVFPSVLYALGLHHAQIIIPVGSEDAARAFYCGVLGMAEIAKPAALAGRGGFWLALDDLQIHVGVGDGVDRHATKAHLAYAVPDLAAWRAHLAAHGVTSVEAIPTPHYDRFEERDPFVNRFGCSEQFS